MLRPGEDPDEAPQHLPEAVFRFLRRQVRNRRRLAEDQLQVGDQGDDERRVRLQRRAQRLPPAVELGFALAEQPADQALEGLRQGRIGNVALVLIELARGEQAARRHERLVQLVDHRGLADAGIARDQDQLGRALGHHAIERLQQPPDLRLAPIELFGDAQDVGDVVGAGR